MLRTILFALAWTFVAAGAAAAPANEREPRIVQEARQFMEGYARDLLAGDRAAVAARYSPSGAYTLGHWAKRFETQAALRQAYASPAWQKPQSFTWTDLSFEPVGLDAVIVVGNLLWGEDATRAPSMIAYTALLRRERNRLMIRVEHENLLSQPPKEN